MSNYLYSDFLEQPLTGRFPTELSGEGYAIRGVREWRLYIGQLLELLYSENEVFRSGVRNTILAKAQGLDTLDPRAPIPPRLASRTTEELILHVLLLSLQQLEPLPPQQRCPRVFISHRQTDKDIALRMVQLAHKSNFAWWVDILDPALASLPSMPGIPTAAIPILSACIIEMAILNCTHVLAAMTPNSAGSAWIPYEYGRIKVRKVITFNTAAWIHPDALPLPFPNDYMLLGEITFREPEITDWLDVEYRAWGKPACRPLPLDHDTFKGVKELPDRKTDPKNPGALLTEEELWEIERAFHQPTIVKPMKLIVLRSKGG